jgi:hypothetical protein
MNQRPSLVAAALLAWCAAGEKVVPLQEELAVTLSVAD